MANLGNIQLGDATACAQVGSLIPGQTRLYASKRWNGCFMIREVSSFQELIAAGGMIVWPTGNLAGQMLLVGEAMHSFLREAPPPFRVQPVPQLTVEDFTPPSTTAQQVDATLRGTWKYRAIFGVSPLATTWTAVAVVSSARTGFGLLASTCANSIVDNIRVASTGTQIDQNVKATSPALIIPRAMTQGAGTGIDPVEAAQDARTPIFGSGMVASFTGSLGSPAWNWFKDVSCLVVDVPWHEPFGALLDRQRANLESEYEGDAHEFFAPAYGYAKTTETNLLNRPPARLMIATSGASVYVGGGPATYVKSVPAGRLQRHGVPKVTPAIYQDTQVKVTTTGSLAGLQIVDTPLFARVALEGVADLWVPWLYDLTPTAGWADAYNNYAFGSFGLEPTAMIGFIGEWDVRLFLARVAPLLLFSPTTGQSLPTTLSVPLTRLGFESIPAIHTEVTSVITTDPVKQASIKANPPKDKSIEAVQSNQTWGLNIVSVLADFTGRMDDEAARLAKSK